MKVVFNTVSQAQQPFKAECYGFGTCSGIEIFWYQDWPQGGVSPFQKDLSLIYDPPKKNVKKESNQYLSVSVTCRAAVSVKLLVMSSHQWAELNPKSTGRGQKWPPSLRLLLEMNPVTKTSQCDSSCSASHWSSLTPYIPAPTCFSRLFCTVRQTQTFSPAARGPSARCLSLSNQHQPNRLLPMTLGEKRSSFP